MKDKRLHDQSASPRGRHRLLAVSLAKLLDLRSRQHTLIVRSRNQPKWTAFQRARVDVKPNCGYSFEYLGWRLNKKAALFFRPASQVIARNAG